MRRISPTIFGLVLGLGLASGCPGDGGSLDETSTCGLGLTTSGDFTTALTGANALGCLTTVSSDTGIFVQYLNPDGPLKRTTLDVAEVSRGMTGTGYPATMLLEHDDGREWLAETCQVTITANDFTTMDEIGEAYLIRGTGTCEPAQAESDTSTVTIEPFEFVVEVSWFGSA